MDLTSAKKWAVIFTKCFLFKTLLVAWSVWNKHQIHWSVNQNSPSLNCQWNISWKSKSLKRAYNREFNFHQINQVLNADIPMKTEKINKLPILVITISRAVRFEENNRRKMSVSSFAKLSIPPLNVRHHLFYVFICSLTVFLMPKVIILRFCLEIRRKTFRWLFISA